MKRSLKFYCIVYIAGIIPKSWRRYTVPAGLTVIQWITDFSERIKQLQTVSQASQQGGPSALKVGILNFKYHAKCPSNISNNTRLCECN